MKPPMNRSQTPVMAPVLWTLGALVSGISLIFAILAGAKECPSDAMCSMGAAIQMLFSVTGVFVGALLVVGGFALRTAERRKWEDRRQRQELKALMDMVAAERAAEEAKRPKTDASGSSDETADSN